MTQITPFSTMLNQMLIAKQTDFWLVVKYRIMTILRKLINHTVKQANKISVGTMH